MKALFEQLVEKLKALGCTEEEVGVFASYAERWESYLTQYGEAQGKICLEVEFEALQVQFLQLERVGAISRRQREQLESFVWEGISA